MKHIALGVLSAAILLANSGCCCLWNKLHHAKGAYGHCGDAGCDGGCGGQCGGDGGGGCGHGDCTGYFDGSCADGCCEDTHYLNPHGAQYGACCAQWGCGQKYWGDCHVPYQRDPCDCCGNWTGHMGPAYQHPGYHGYGPSGYEPSGYDQGYGYGYAQKQPPANYVESKSGAIQYAEKPAAPKKVVQQPAAPEQRSIAKPLMSKRTTGATLRSR